MLTMLGRCARATLAATTMLLVACGGGSKAAAPAPVAPAAPRTAAPRTAAPSAAPSGLALALGEVTVYDGEDALFKLHADGTTELGDRANGQLTWYPGPTFQADGTLLVEGRARARLTGQGIAIAGSDQLLPLAVGADRVDVESISFSLAQDGALRVSGLDTGDTRLRFEGASAETRHAGLVVWTALFVLAQAQGGAGQDAPR